MLIVLEPIGDEHPHLTERERIDLWLLLAEKVGLPRVMPCFNNLVLFDPFKPVETMDTIIPELAERWSWQDG